MGAQAVEDATPGRAKDLLNQLQLDAACFGSSAATDAGCQYDTTDGHGPCAFAARLSPVVCGVALGASPSVMFVP